MKSTEYLYDIDADELDDMKYFDALKHKLESSQKLFKHLYTLPPKEQTQEVQKRLFHVNKAIEHTRKLLEERDECE